MNPSNYSFISFPFLGLELNPPRTLSIGPLTVYYYGLIIAIGLILALSYAGKRSKEFGLTEDQKVLAADFADSLSLYLDGGDADGTTD